MVCSKEYDLVSTDHVGKQVLTQNLNAFISPLPNPFHSSYAPQHSLPFCTPPDSLDSQAAIFPNLNPAHKLGSHSTTQSLQPGSNLS